MDNPSRRDNLFYHALWEVLLSNIFMQYAISSTMMGFEVYFTFDPEKGEWRNKAVGYRFVLLGEPFYINMILNLSQFGRAAGVFFYQRAA